MKPKFQVGQRVRVIRASPGWGASIGDLGTVESYEGANALGTDWEVSVICDGAVAFEPAFPFDESCLEAAGPGAFEPLLFEPQCLAADGTRLDAIVTRIEVVDAVDMQAAYARRDVALASMQPVLGGTELCTGLSWYWLTDDPREALVFTTTWCGCRPWTDIVEPLRRSFPETCDVIDDGWAVEFILPRDGATALLGEDAVGFRLFVEPWSSFLRRPEGQRYRLNHPGA